MKNRIWIALLIASSVLLAGCIKHKTLVVVNPDGSGNIVVSTLMSPQAAGMIGGMADSFGDAFGADGKEGGKPAVKKDPFFDEEQLKKAAAAFGEGVSYVKGRKANEEGWQGSVAVYQFADVSKIKLPMDGGKGMSPPGMDMDEESESPADAKKAVTFDFAGGDVKTLTIHVPQDDEAKKKEPKQKPAVPEGGPDMSAMMMPMLQGMEMSFAVQVKGEVASSTAMNNESDGRIILMQMDLNKMQASPKFKELLASSQGGEDEPPKEELLGMPGVKVETNKIVKIEFK